jgi:hypothetical protein
MVELKRYMSYGAVVIAALLLGRWYSKERDRMMVRGEPWYKSWTTIPGLTIIIILIVLVVMKLKYN